MAVLERTAVDHRGCPSLRTTSGIAGSRRSGNIRPRVRRRSCRCLPRLNHLLPARLNERFNAVFDLTYSSPILFFTFGLPRRAYISLTGNRARFIGSLRHHLDGPLAPVSLRLEKGLCWFLFTYPPTASARLYLCLSPIRHHLHGLAVGSFSTSIIAVHPHCSPPDSSSSLSSRRTPRCEYIYTDAATIAL
jgi:hypothetical protein